MCDSPPFERRINSQPLIKRAHTPGGPGVGTTGVNPWKQGWEQGADMWSVQQ